MSDQTIVCLLDNLNKMLEKEITIKTPKTYQELMTQIKNEFKKLPNDYSIFYLTNDKSEVIINESDNDEYKLSRDIIFVRQKEVINIKESLYTKIYNMLPESSKEFVDEIYNCFICNENINNENPYFCYICQKIFHINCLGDWNKKKQSKNEVLNCPSCRNELPLELWKQQLNFEEKKSRAAEIMNMINDYELANNLNNNLIYINEKIIRQLKNEIYQMNQDKINEVSPTEELEQLKKENINQTTEIHELRGCIKKNAFLFKSVLNKIKEISSLINPDANKKLINIISELSSDPYNPPLDNISAILFEELESLQQYINNIKNFKNFKNLENVKEQKEEIFEKITEYKKEIDLMYFTKSEGKQNILGKEFVQRNMNNIELMINEKKNNLFPYFNLRKGENYIKILIKNNLTNLNNMFNSCTSLKNIDGLKYLDTRNVTDFSYMFWGCTSLSDIRPIQHFVVINCQNYQGMFGGCTSLSDIKPLQNWNVSKGNNFSTMFFSCTSLSDIKPLGNWNVSNNTNFSGMFSKCKLLSDIKPLEKWKVSKGDNFTAMFFECKLLSDISPIQNWNVSKGKLFKRMFYDTKALLSSSKSLQKWKLSKDDFDSMFI